MFTQSAFIIKNTPELREKLEALGYETALSKRGDIIIVDSDGTYVCVFENEVYYNKMNDFINCYDNEPLFLAIAALRDDSDYMQWFTDGERFLRCKFKETHLTDVGYHKATPEELQEHFK